LDEVIDFFVREIDPAPGWSDQGLVQVQSVFWPGYLVFFDGTLKTKEDQLACRTSLLRRRFVKPTMQFNWDVD
jgi:hypothetical protein